LGCPSEFLGVPSGQSTYHPARAEFDEAQLLAESMLRLIHDRSDPVGLVLDHYSAGRNLMFVGKFDLSRLHFERAIALCVKGVPAAIVDQAGRHPGVASQAFLGNALSCQGFRDQALVQCHCAITDATRLTHPPSLASLSSCTMMLSLLEDATALAEPAAKLVAIATGQDFSHWRATGTMIHGWARIKTGDIVEGMALLRGGLNAYRADGEEWAVPRYVDLFAVACETAGDVAEAASLLDDHPAIVESTGGWH
jgi:hypothetical protein